MKTKDIISGLRFATARLRVLSNSIDVKLDVSEIKEFDSQIDELVYHINALIELEGKRS